jgi:hypothetical protein
MKTCRRMKKAIVCLLLLCQHLLARNSAIKLIVSLLIIIMLSVHSHFAPCYFAVNTIDENIVKRFHNFGALFSLKRSLPCSQKLQNANTVL